MTVFVAPRIATFAKAPHGGRARSSCLLGVLAALGAATSCKPKLASNDWLVTSTRVIAVQGAAPETKPGTPATYTAFVATPSGASYAGSIAFSFCNAPKPPGENGVVAAKCLGTSSLGRIGFENPVIATTPANACSLFGPIAPPGGLRPADPDATGGYYQPVRVDLPGTEPTFHLARIACGVANASADVAEDFAMTYVLNRNPHIAGLSASARGAPASFDSIPPGARVELVASWTSADAERYVSFDPDTGTLQKRHEAMQIAWFVTGGTLDTESTSRGDGERATTSTNGWVVPAAPGRAHVWVVLRDSRGGVDVLDRGVTVSTEPATDASAAEATPDGDALIRDASALPDGGDD